METKNERPSKQPKYWAMGVAAVLVTAFVLVQPTMQTTYAQVAEEGVPEFFNCEFDTNEQADDPLDMNTIRNKDVAKTIIAEKEFFECETVQGGIDILLDVTLIAEIFENMTTKSIISKQAHVITCAKLEDGVALGCDTYRPRTDFIPVSECDDDPKTITHPQEMNTVNKGNTVKTIIAQKEIFYCSFEENVDVNFDAPDSDDKKVDQYFIEEIWENLSLLPGDTVVQKNVESLRCWILLTDAFVESCQFTSLQVQELELE